jgi:hypothetical protein
VRTLRLLGWPFLVIGLVVAVTALLYAVVLDEDLRRESFIASTRWNLARAAELDERRGHVSTWPALFAGVGLTAVGLALLEIRRRMARRAEQAITPAELMPLIGSVGQRASPPPPARTP